MNTIQRVPRGLLELIGAFGGVNPRLMTDEVRPVISLEQFFARMQLQVTSTTNAALAEGGQIVHTASTWQLLIAAEVRLTTTATMNGWETSIRFGTNVTGNSVALASRANNPFTAGIPAGVISSCVFVPDTPFVLAPGNLILGTLDVLGTDATAAVDLRIAFGSLG